jgi:hypothetical protein
MIGQNENNTVDKVENPSKVCPCLTSSQFSQVDESVLMLSLNSDYMILSRFFSKIMPRLFWNGIPEYLKTWEHPVFCLQYLEIVSPAIFCVFDLVRKLYKAKHQ